MTPTAKDAHPPFRKDPVNLALVVSLLLLLALLPFGTVRPDHRLALALGAGLLGPALALTAPGGRAGRGAGIALSLAALGWAWGALGALPLDAAGRARLQPGFAEAVEVAVQVVGDFTHPLALDPWRALVEWGLAGALLALAAGVAAAAARPGFARRLCWGLVGLGLLVLVIAAVHRGTGAASIWWVSGVPSFARDPFFAPFVSPNHAGAFLAALLGVALGLAAGGQGRERQAALASAGFLALGVFAAGARAAAMSAGVAALAVALICGARWVRIGAAAVVALAVALLGGLGPERVALAVTKVLAPGLYRQIQRGDSDLLTGRGELYREVILMIEGAPLAGVGGGGFGDAYELVRQSVDFGTAAHAHQEPLQVAAEHGLPALGLWALGVLVGLVAALGLALRAAPEERALRAGALAGLLALGVDAQLDFPLRIGAVALLAAILAGVALGLVGEGAARRPRWTLALALPALLATVFAGGLRVLEPTRSDWAPVGDALALGDEAITLALEEQDGDARAGLAATALSWYEEAARRAPTRREPLQKLGRLRRVLGDADGAEQALQAATVVTPRVPWAWRDLARLRDDRGDLIGGAAAWQAALSLDLPGDSAPFLREALTSELELSARADRVLPLRADRWLTAAKVAEERRDTHTAERFYRRAVDLEPELAVELAGALLRWDRTEEAEALLPQIVGSCRETIVGAEIAFAQRSFEQARQGFERALTECGPKERRARLGLARAKIALGDPAGMRALETIIAEDPGDRAALRVMIRELERQDRRKEARAYQERLDAPLPQKAVEVPVPER